MSYKNARTGEGMDAKKWDVYCNEQKLNHCFEADDEKGFATIYKRDAMGNFVEGTGDVAVERIEGVIRFEEMAAL